MFFSFFARVSGITRVVLPLRVHFSCVKRATRETTMDSCERPLYEVFEDLSKRTTRSSAKKTQPQATRQRQDDVPDVHARKDATPATHPMHGDGTSFLRGTSPLRTPKRAVTPVRSSGRVRTLTEKAKDGFGGLVSTASKLLAQAIMPSTTTTPSRGVTFTSPHGTVSKPGHKTPTPAQFVGDQQQGASDQDGDGGAAEDDQSTVHDVFDIQEGENKAEEPPAALEMMETTEPSTKRGTNKRRGTNKALLQSKAAIQRKLLEMEKEERKLAKATASMAKKLQKGARSRRKIVEVKDSESSEESDVEHDLRGQHTFNNNASVSTTTTTTALDVPACTDVRSAATMMVTALKLRQEWTQVDWATLCNATTMVWDAIEHVVGTECHPRMARGPTVEERQQLITAASTVLRMVESTATTSLGQPRSTPLATEPSDIAVPTERGVAVILPGKSVKTSLCMRLGALGTTLKYSPWDSLPQHLYAMHWMTGGSDGRVLGVAGNVTAIISSFEQHRYTSAAISQIHEMLKSVKVTSLYPFSQRPRVNQSLAMFDGFENMITVFHDVFGPQHPLTEAFATLRDHRSLSDCYVQLFNIAKAAGYADGAADEWATELTHTRFVTAFARWNARVNDLLRREITTVIADNDAEGVATTPRMPAITLDAPSFITFWDAWAVPSLAKAPTSTSTSPPTPTTTTPVVTLASTPAPAKPRINISKDNIPKELAVVLSNPPRNISAILRACPEATRYAINGKLICLNHILARCKNSPCSRSHDLEGAKRATPATTTTTTTA